MGLATKI